ncbi:MAG: hypothetical protein IIV61_06025 [Oscillospiraceae bacterium]|nr:hypothetical protein [Oscillospiraceae bacterium]
MDVFGHRPHGCGAGPIVTTGTAIVVGLGHAPAGDLALRDHIALTGDHDHKGRPQIHRICGGEGMPSPYSDNDLARTGKA